MSPRTRESVIRKLLGALLNSDLSIDELREVARAFSNGLSRDIGQVLGAAISQLEVASYRKVQSRLSSDEDLVYSLIQRRKLSKNELFELLSATNSNKLLRERIARSSKTPIRGILREYFRTASPDSVRTLIEKLQPSEGTDPYLRGIIRRD